MTEQEINEEKAWKATRKEYEIGENESPKVTKVVYEQKKMKIFGVEVEDTMNLIVKVVGIFAIFTPLAILLAQRKLDTIKEDKKEKALLFGQIIKSYASIFHHPNYAYESLSAIDSVNFLLDSEPGFTDNDTPLFAKVKKLNSNLSLYTDVKKKVIYMDSLGTLSIQAVNAIDGIYKDRNNTKKSIKGYPGYSSFKTFITMFPEYAVLNLEREQDQVSIDRERKEDSTERKLDSIKNLIDIKCINNYTKLDAIYTQLQEVAALKRENTKPNDIFFHPNYIEGVDKVKIKDEGNNSDVFFVQLDESRKLISQYLPLLKQEFHKLKEQMDKELKK